MNKFLLGYKVLRELGIKQAVLYALYRFGLSTGHYRRTLDAIRKLEFTLQYPAQINVPAYLKPVRSIQGQPGSFTTSSNSSTKNEIRRVIESIRVQFPVNTVDWSLWSKQPAAREVDDIRLLWEDARLGWAVDLAYLYSQPEDIMSQVDRDNIEQVFWEKLIEFDANNPPYYGVNWISAQEAAIRILHLAYAWSVFGSTHLVSKDRTDQFARIIHAHASRIPVTMIYARAQNNNHLLSEAAGLITAAALLPGSPESVHWMELGWHWFEKGIDQQVADSGEYNQHSATYHRMMLVLALWVNANRQGRVWQMGTWNKLQQAARWYLDLLIADTFDLPFFGSDDSSRVLIPASINPEMFILDLKSVFSVDQNENSAPAGLIPLQSEHTRGYLRVGKFTSRPSHADQLHFDLWYDHTNVLCDPGTFSYNRQPPWENPFATSLVHNTVVIDQRDQMTRAGKFLWLDWAQAQVDELLSDDRGNLQSISARHTGYQKIGVIHGRKVSIVGDDEWLVDDRLVNSKPDNVHSARLQWNLPAWSWQLRDDGIACEYEGVQIQLQISSSEQINISLISAGQALKGSKSAQSWEGWLSRKYGEKQPGLLLIAETEFHEDLQFSTRIILRSGGLLSRSE